MPASLDACTGALLGLLCGDALGMPYEDGPAGAVPERLEMVDGWLPRGTGTDDTLSALALARSLARHGEVVPEDVARELVAVFDPGRGFGPGTSAVVAHWRAGVPVAEAAARVGAASNGAAMRVAPVGLAFCADPVRCDEQARLQARVTHAHPHAEDGAAAVACAVAAAARGEDPLGAAVAAARTPELRALLERALAMAPGEAARLGSGIGTLESVPAALLAASAATYEDAVTCAVRCGGDTDTLAAIAGAVAGARDGAEAIPARWADALAGGDDGRAGVLAAARALSAV